MKLNCLVIEDSAVQRMIVVKLVNNNTQLHLVGDFSNAIEARNCLNIHSIDLIFLDIEMPVINGFSFLEGLKTKPQIIFVTAKAEHALRAFDYAPTDYIKKPVTLNRFEIAVHRALHLHQLEHETKEETGEHIYIKSNLKKIKIFTSKIKWIEAFGDYVKVVTDESSNLVLSTMKSFETNLNPTQFVRVHKSFIINTDKIERYNSKFAEIGTSKIPLSRNKKDALVKALAIE
ncbi:LytR/AlgR family response regulator transcription factor [Flavobacterium ammonificans]|uniref:LytR/AlgR family response regulator transcription factor n=1 Tax=Flavobacterium ammonificans TaxID=1751056 RepID=UPI001E61EB8C|nr:LytTR family DNA-binding domain-containing protein [Flavobacterium ammonificans]BDB57265.1 DNA-binding response regulator [Flavobacterium ammonificans]